jgi:hypothetical protein
MLLTAHCKSVTRSTDRRHIERELTPQYKGEPAADTRNDALPAASEQAVTLEEIQAVPNVEAPAPSTGQTVMVPEIGSQCKLPVTAACLGLKVDAMASTSAPQDLGKAIRKYGRTISKEVHKCNYYSRNLASFPNISYFIDSVVYWSEVDNSIRYQSRSVNFIFAAGCFLDEDFKNPYASQILQTQTWDGTSTLKSLNYRLAGQVSKLETFAIDKTKAEKITQEAHKCDWAVRPLIYAFPDGVAYQLINSDSINFFSYNQVKAMGCILPPNITTEAEKIAPKCALTAINPDPAQRQSLNDLGLLPTSSMTLLVDQPLVDQLETSGVLRLRADFNCPFAAVRFGRILQFSDGAAFFDGYCGKAEFFTNQYLLDKQCTIPPLVSADAAGKAG